MTSVVLAPLRRVKRKFRASMTSVDKIVNKLPKLDLMTALPHLSAVRMRSTQRMCEACFGTHTERQDFSVYPITSSDARQLSRLQVKKSIVQLLAQLLPIFPPLRRLGDNLPSDLIEENLAMHLYRYSLLTECSNCTVGHVRGILYHLQRLEHVDRQLFECITKELKDFESDIADQLARLM